MTDPGWVFLLVSAKGVISVLSNIMPDGMHCITANALAGKTVQSVDAQLQLLDIANILFCDVNPIPVKYAMKVLGLDSGVYRLPLSDTSEANKRHIRDCLRKYKLIN